MHLTTLHPIRRFFHRELLFAPALLLLFVACPHVLTVAIISPGDGTTVRGSVTVRARATSPDPIVTVDLYINDVFLAADSTGSGDVYEFTVVNTALVSDSTNRLFCIARDAAGATATSPVINVFAIPGTRHTGSITEPETWSPDSNPHIVEGDLLVQALLTIEPGVEVLFAANAGITVGRGAPGALQARGTAGSPVRFTSAAPQPAPGDWRAISFRTGTGTDSSILRHCIVAYGGGNRGMVHAEAVNAAVESCSLYGSSTWGAVAESTGFTRFANNTIAGCVLPVRVDPAWTGLVDTSNTFAGNVHDAVGIAGGTLTASTEWELKPWPYCVLATVSISGPASPVLTIGAGCTLQFADSAALRVGIGFTGALSANGIEHPILFTGFSDTPGPATWPGIEFWHQTDPVRTAMRRCVVENAGRGAAAAIVCYGSPLISETTVRNGPGDGITCSGTDFTQFAGNTVTGNAGYPLLLDAPAVGTVGGNNSFSGNGRDSVVVRGGRISHTSQWRNIGVPWSITGTIEVGGTAAPTMIVDQGARLVFAPGAGLEIGLDSVGMLSASGITDSVTFTGVDTIPGSWRGISLYRLAGSQTRLELCRILYGGAGHPGILYIRESAPTISNCEIGWSSNNCVVLRDSPLTPDSLLAQNWIHNPAPDFEEVVEEEPLPGAGRPRP